MRRKVSSIDASQSEYMTFEQFQREVIPWSIDTFKRRVEEDGFPAIKDRGGWVVSRNAARDWFKRREVQAG